MIAYTPPPSIAEAADQLHQTLDALALPSQLEQSAWASSCLVAQRLAEQAGLPRSQTLRAILTEALARFEQHDPKLADLLRGRFWQGLAVKAMLAADRPERQSERRFHEQQNLALERFVELLLSDESLCAQNQHHHRLLHRLPITTYRRLFGVDVMTEQALHFLHDPQRHPVVSIKGIGGIGKTALTNHVIRQHLVHNGALHDLLWVSAKQEYLTTTGIEGVHTQVRIEHLFDELGLKLGLGEVPRLPIAQKVESLATKLRTVPYLVVLDNLESVEDFRQLVPWLEKLANPTQFLLTCRQTIPSLTSVTKLELGELKQPDAIALIEFMANEKQIANCNAYEVYKRVGGNPLAIILLVSQMQEVSPEPVLNNVDKGGIDNLYTYIYWNVWQVLKPDDKEVLFAIQRAGDQADWTWLEMTSQLPESDLEQALLRLCNFSLIQTQRGHEEQPTYTIHRLTSTFLRSEVLGWK